MLNWMLQVFMTIPHTCTCCVKAKVSHSFHKKSTWAYSILLTTTWKVFHCRKYWFPYSTIKISTFPLFNTLPTEKFFEQLEYCSLRISLHTKIFILYLRKLLCLKIVMYKMLVSKMFIVYMYECLAHIQLLTRYVENFFVCLIFIVLGDNKKLFTGKISPITACKIFNWETFLQMNKFLLTNCSRKYFRI